MNRYYIKPFSSIPSLQVAEHVILGQCIQLRDPVALLMDDRVTTPSGDPAVPSCDVEAGAALAPRTNTSTRSQWQRIKGAQGPKGMNLGEVILHHDTPEALN